MIESCFTNGRPHRFSMPTKQMSWGDPKGGGRREIFGWVVLSALTCLWLAYTANTLPIGVPPDGFWYLYLSDRFFSDGPGPAWDYVRMPLYPLAIRAATEIFGYSSYTLIGLNTTLLFAATLCLSIAVRISFGAPSGFATLLLLSIYPPNIAFAHVVLTESGQYFFVSAAVLLLSLHATNWRVPPSIVATTLVLILGIGFLWRQNIALLSPAVAICFSFAGRARNREPVHRKSKGSSRLRGLLLRQRWTMAILVLPLLALPTWKLVAERHGGDASEGYAAHLYGAMLQALPKPDSPRLDDVFREQYFSALHEGAPFGRIPLHGLHTETFWEMLKTFYSSTPQPKKLFWSLVGDYPERYGAAVLRTLAYLLGAKTDYSSVQRISRRILTRNWDTINKRWPINYHPEVERHVRSRLQLPNLGQPYVSAAQALVGTLEPFRALVLLGGIVSAVLAVLALVTRNARLSWLGLIPMCFIGPYVVLLMSDDRYAYPVHPLYLASIATVAVYLVTAAAKLLRPDLVDRDHPAERSCK